MAGLKNDFALADGMNSGNQITFRRVLQQIGPRSCLQRADHIALVGVHAENHDRRFRAGGGDLACRLDAVQIGHGDVHHDDVRRHGFSHAHAFAAIGGLAHYHKVRLTLQ